MSGGRRRAIVAVELAALAALWAALFGPPRQRTQDVPRRIVYLVDGSASLDESQREWITRRIASLESRRPGVMPRAVAVFGSDARSAVPLGTEPLTDPAAIRDALTRLDIGPDRTNLEAALLAVPGFLASPDAPAAAGGQPSARGRVILLSDGRETAGDLALVLPAVRRLGLEVFPEPPPASGALKTVWEELAVPSTVQLGSPVPLQLVLFNGSSGAKRADVTVGLHGIAVKRQRLAVRPGWQVLTVPVPSIGRGTMALDVRVAIPEEGLSESRLAYTEVEGPPRVLMVSDRTAAFPPLAAALKRREIDVANARPSDLPAETPPLLEYDAVLLFNVPKSSVTPEQAAALHAYVEAHGGGLLTVGLGGVLADEIQTASALDPLLPVQFEPKGLQEAKRRVCFILLIDRSASMLGPRISATKRAAVELVKQLSPEDLVGVLAFDTKPYVVAEVQPAGQVGSQLVEKLVKLRSTGGTDVYPALAAAANRLDLTGATLKHIILLSDGNTPFHETAYEALIESFRLSGTTVSTIGIGAAFVNTEYLQWLAGSTGGTFYQMRNLDELPKLIARDTQAQLGRLPFTEGRFRPAASPTTDWFRDVADWPALRGYLTATAKPGARVDLTVNGGEGDDPLLARWLVGRGRVVSFTSDADARWSPEWIRWPAFEGTWAHVARWAMRPRLTEELFVWTDRSGAAPELVIEGELHAPQASLVGSGSTSAIPLSLIQTGTWKWQASLEQVPSGWYQLTLESHPPEAAGAAIFARRWLQVGTPPSSGEVTGQPPNEALLRQVAQATSGAYGAPDRAMLPPTSPATVTESAMAWWLPLVVLLLLAEVALRGSSML